MPEVISHTSPIVTATEAHERRALWPGLAEKVTVPKLAVIAFVLGIAIMLAYRPWRQSEGGDPAIYDYIAQAILRGQMPYRDVVDIKGPLGPYMSAMAMTVGKLIGVRDIIAVRLFHVLMVGLLSAVTFLVAEIYLRNRLAAFIAFLVPLLPENFALMTISGTQPKLSMILFGMLTLLMIARDKPFWAGLCSMLSCLCWQPGLMFTGTAVLIFSRYLTTWRDLRAIKVIIGAAIPLGVVVGYFYARGALSDLWAWAIIYNVSVFGPEAKAGTGQAITKLWQIIIRVFKYDRPLVILSLLGLVIFTFDRLRDKLKGRAQLAGPDLFRDAVAIPALVYLAFCLINFQASADLIPFFPFIGIFAGWFFVRTGRFVSSVDWIKIRGRHLVKDWHVPALALVTIMIVLLTRTLTYHLDTWTLQDQDQEFKPLSNLLGPDDKIYVHGTAEILVLLNRPNLNPYVILDWDADNFAGARRLDGWDGIMNEMESEAPKLVAVSRLRTVTHRADIERWVQDHYEKFDLVRYERVYIRKR